MGLPLWAHRYRPRTVLTVHLDAATFDSWYHYWALHTLSAGWSYVLIGDLVALVLVWANPGNTWHYVRPLVTWVHESGHAIATVLLSGEVHGMRLNRDTSGVTRCAVATHRGLFGMFRDGLVSFAGTPTPMIVGAAIAVGLCYGMVRLIIGVIALALVLTLPQLRNWWGLLVVLTLGVLMTICWVAPAAVQATILGIMAGVLSLGGLKTVFEEHQKRANRTGEGDTEAAAAAMHLPVVFIEGAWLGIWAASTLAALAVLVAH